MSSRRNRRLPLPTRSSSTVGTRSEARAKILPAEEWENMRSIVKRHYIDEGKTLQQVLKVFLREHNFKVTPPALKARLKEWEFGKNFKKAELEAAAKAAKQCAESGLPLPQDLRINGRPYAWDRVNRHFGLDPRHKYSWLQIDSQCKTTIMSPSVGPFSMDHNLEKILNGVRDYWVFTLARAETRASVRVRRRAVSKDLKCDPKNIRVRFLSALRLFSWGQERRCWREIDKTCHDLLNVLEVQEPDLLKEVILLFTAVAWAPHPDLFGAVVNYVYAFCAGSNALGPHHPLTVILQNFTSLTHSMKLFDELKERALKFMIDAAEAAPDKVNLDRGYITAVESTYVSRLQAKLGWHEAKKLIEHWFSRYRRTFGERNPYTLFMQTELARLYMEEALRARERGERVQAEICEAEAERILLPLVKWGEESPRDCPRNGAYIQATARLGQLYFGRQEFQKSQDHYCKALTWAAWKHGDHHPYISFLLKPFRALQRMGELGLVNIKTLDGVGDKTLHATLSGTYCVGDMEAFSPQTFYPAEVNQNAGNLAPEGFSTSPPARQLDSTVVVEEGDVLPSAEDSVVEVLTIDTVDPYLNKADQVFKGQDMHDGHDTLPYSCGDWALKFPEDPNSSMLHDGNAVTPSDEPPDYFPRNLFGQDMCMDEIDQLFERQ